jgi:alpha-ketoglutarate-dependent taurine dioxygenase
MTSTATLRSVVELEVDPKLSWWPQENGPILATLVDHFGRELPGAALPEPADPAALRSQLRRVAPALAAICDRVRAAFDADGAAAVLVPRLGLAGVDLDEQRKAVFALAALLGDPSANLPFDHVLWDVKNRGDQKSGYMSFSENDHKANYHTDNGAFLIPERFFLLYVVRAAECGGGISKLRDIRVIKKQLEQTEHGRAVIRLLTETKLPKRISPPELYVKAEVAEDGFQYTPVFADMPMVRWRTNGLYKGLAAKPEYDTPEVRDALDTVRGLLENGTPELRQVIPSDGLLIVNNHIALHGRSAFTDPHRHLLRLRFHEAVKHAG